MARSNGATLVELLVVIMVLGILAAVSALVLSGWNRPDGEGEDESTAEIVARIAEEALRNRTTVTRPVSFGDSVVLVTGLPDGRLLGVER